MNILVIDFETQDWYLSDKNGYGSGWCYPDPDGTKMIILGAAIHREKETFWEDSIPAIKEHVLWADVIIAHNMNYDGGILLKIGCDLKDKTLIDTMVLAKLYNNLLPSYSLNDLALSLLGESKNTDELGECAKKLGLVGSIAMDANKVAYANMKAIYESFYEIVVDYALQDVDLTVKLYKLFYPTIDKFLIQTYSQLYKMLLYSRQKGVRIDLDATRKACEVFKKSVDEIQAEANKLSGVPINLNSAKQLGAYFASKNVRTALTARSSPSFAAESIKDRDDDPMFEVIRNFRLDYKALNSFAQKFLDMQYITLGVDSLEGIKYGRLYPEIKPLEAITGRFTHASPNIAQLPSRNPEIFKAIRSIIVPEEGQDLFALDFSNQEGRLQVHFAAKYQAKNHFPIVHLMNEKPYTDLHQFVADIVGTTRKEAKAINLGLSYGMGVSKTSKQLSFSDSIIQEIIEKNQDEDFCVQLDPETGNNVWNIYGDYYSKQGLYPVKMSALSLTDKKTCAKLIITRGLIQQYHEKAPYLKDTIERMKGIAKRQGYIETVGGRKVRVEQNREYKVFNAVIQGSAADQTITALVKAYEAGLHILFSVHDEIVMTGDEFDAETLKEIMETSTPLAIPVKVGSEESVYKAGKNWFEAK